MKVQRSVLGTQGFSLVEMLCVIAIIGILAALLLPAISRARQHSHRIACINNLQQVGVAFHSFAHDHKDQFPMRVTQSDGGSKEFMEAAYQTEDGFYFSYRHFQSLSNDLGSPGPLVCPADSRLPARNFATLRNENLSYFVTPNAKLGMSSSLLAGDRNLTSRSTGVQSVYRMDTNDSMRWTAGLHEMKGNLLFADGHVEKANGRQLKLTGDPSFQATDLHLPELTPTQGLRPPPTTGEFQIDPEPASPEQVESNAPPSEEALWLAEGTNAGAGGGSSQSIHSQSEVGMVPLNEVEATAPAKVQIPVTHTLSTNSVTVTSIPVEQKETPPAKSTHRGWWWLLLLVALVVYLIRRAWQRTGNLPHPDAQ